MFEILFYPTMIHISHGVLSCYYNAKFLKKSLKNKFVIPLWCIAYFSFEMTFFEILPRKYGIQNDALEILINFCFLTILQLCFFCRDLSRQLFLTASFLAGIYLLNYIVEVLSGTIINLWIIRRVEAMPFVYSCILKICMVLFFIALMLAYLKGIEVVFSRKTYELNMLETALLLAPCVTALGFYLTVQRMVLYIERAADMLVYDTIPAINFWMPFICVMLLLSIIANIALFQNLIIHEEENRKRIILENQIGQMQKEITEIEGIYSDIRGLQHDMKNHINNIMLWIKGMTDVDTNEIRNYVGKMEEAVNRLDFSYKSGNPITDIIIHQRQQDAREKHINFEVDFAYPMGQEIDVYDMAVILNNALENAFEASIHVEGEKSIYLTSYMKGNLFFIEVENDYMGDVILNEATGLPESRKEDKKAHGIGLSNIQKCARKYQGDIDIDRYVRDGKQRFNLTVMMQGGISRR